MGHYTIENAYIYMQHIHIAHNTPANIQEIYPYVWYTTEYIIIQRARLDIARALAYPFLGGSGWRSGLGAGKWLFDIYACAAKQPAAHSVLGYKKSARARYQTARFVYWCRLLVLVLLLFASCRLVPKVKQKPDMRVF